MSGLKRWLTKNGWQVKSEDSKAGILAATKGLAPYEKIKTSAFTTGMTGVSSAGQTGRLAFTFRQDSTSTDSVVTRFDMNGQIQVQMNQRSGFTAQQSSSTRRVARGHPMMILYGQWINENENVELIDPKPEKLPKSKHGPSGQN